MAGRDVGEAAERLRHDLGKVIRRSAPEPLEEDTEVLRDRLRADVLSTRRDASGLHSAAEVFEQWRDEEAKRFPTEGVLAEWLSRLGLTIGEIRILASKIDTLDRSGLERLDLLTRAVAQACRALAAAAKDIASKGC
jgi:hypothetical protein